MNQDRQSQSNRLTTPVNRRTFIKWTAAAAAFPMILPRSVFGANERINMAWIGGGSMGGGHLRNMPVDQVNLVALADVDENCGGRRNFDRFKNPRFYQDFRVMLEKHEHEIDAVGIATPDHVHFACAYMAMAMGKHVFVEKPLAHTVEQTRLLKALAKEKGVKTQMGNQGRMSEGIRLIKEWYEAGLIGEVREIIASTDRPAAGSGFRPVSPREYPPAEDVPNNLDWDLWLGPITDSVPYNSEIHPRFWRGWWALGCGGLGDIGCHTLDAPFWAMNLGAPKRVEVEMEGEPNPIHTPLGAVVSYEFDVPNGKPPVRIKWYEGPTDPKLPEGYDLPERASGLHDVGGMVMVGDKGVIAHGHMRPGAPRLYPDARWEEFRANPELRPERTLPRVRGGIMSNFLNAIVNDTTTVSDFGYAADLTEMILLGTLAIRTGAQIEYDADNMRITNNPAADALLRSGVRPGWDVTRGA